MAQAATDQKKVASRSEAPTWYAGYMVLDPEGRKIGVAKEVFANARGEPEYVKLGMGMFGLRSALIPVQLVALDDKRRTITLH